MEYKSPRTSTGNVEISMQQPQSAKTTSEIYAHPMKVWKTGSKFVEQPLDFGKINAELIIFGEKLPVVTTVHAKAVLDHVIIPTEVEQSVKAMIVPGKEFTPAGVEFLRSLVAQFPDHSMANMVAAAIEAKQPALAVAFHELRLSKRQ